MCSQLTQDNTQSCPKTADTAAPLQWVKSERAPNGRNISETTRKTFIFGIELGHTEKAPKGGGAGSSLCFQSSAGKC